MFSAAVSLYDGEGAQSGHAAGAIFQNDDSGRLDETALLERGLDERGKQRMRLEWA